MMKKKTASIALACVLVLGAVPSAASAAATADTVKAKTVFNLDPEGNKIQSTKDNKSSTVDITESSVTADSIQLKGNVVTEQGAIPFDISGALSKSSNSDNRVIGHLEDKNGKFRVVHFSIDGDPKNSHYADKSLTASKKTVVKLYLMSTESRDFTYLEVEAPELLKGSPYEQQVNAGNLPVAEHIDEFWYAKILKPVSTSKQKLPAVTTNGIGTEAMKAYEYPIQYTYSYNAAGATVTENFKVGHYVSTPDTITNQGRWYAKLRVLSESTVCPADPSMNSSNTNFKIGWYADSNIRAYTEAGDAFDLAGWAANVSQGGLSFKLSWNKYSYSYGPLEFAVSYESYKDTTIGNTQNFVNSSTTTLTRQAELKYKKGMILAGTANYFDAYFDVGHYLTNGTKWLNVQFEYDISNGMDYTYGGVQRDTEYLSYYSGT